jgi:hypothetical protein
MLALAMRLTLQGAATTDEKRSICNLFVNAAAKVLRSDIDFAPDSQLFMKIAFSRIQLFSGDSGLANEARGAWRLLSGLNADSLGMNFDRVESMCLASWVSRFDIYLDRYRPYHPLLWRRQERSRRKAATSARRRNGSSRSHTCSESSLG